MDSFIYLLVKSYEKDCGMQAYEYTYLEVPNSELVSKTQHTVHLFVFQEPFLLP